MALPTNMSTGGGVVAVSGIVLGLFPSDRNFDVELQRSTAATAPSSQWQQVRTFSLGDNSEIVYQDRLPLSTKLAYYRARHVKTGYTAGNYSAIISAKPKLLISIALPPPGFGSTASRLQKPIVPLPIPANLAINGDFEDYFFAPGTNGVLVPQFWVGEAGRITYETATPFSGVGYLLGTYLTIKIVALQAANPTAFNTAVGNTQALAYIRVQPGDVLNVHAAAKDFSDVAVGFRKFDSTYTLVGDTDVLTWTGGTAVWIAKDGTYTVPAGTYYLVIKLRAAHGGVGPFTASFDEVRVRY